MTDLALTLIRHGQTEWSRNGRHTSLTELDLLTEGRSRAERLAHVLHADRFDLALCSPRLRARETARLAGFSSDLEISEDLAEWDYGDYEGLTSAEIHAEAPSWNLWRDGCPGGESPAQVRDRVDRVIARALAQGGEVILFAHGHVLRALAARWLGAEVARGACLALDPATVSRLGSERQVRQIERWNALPPPISR